MSIYAVMLKIPNLHLCMVCYLLKGILLYLLYNARVIVLNDYTEIRSSKFIQDGHSLSLYAYWSISMSQYHLSEIID